MIDVLPLAVSMLPVDSFDLFGRLMACMLTFLFFLPWES